MNEPVGYSETQVLGATKVGGVVQAMSLVGVLPAVAVMASRGASTLDWAILGGIAVVMVALPWTMVHRVRVGGGRVRVRFWFLPGADIDAETIEGLQVVRFHPLSDFGGWGLKLTRKHGRVYCISGTTGVRFRSGRRRYVIGSTDAPGLALAIAEAGAPAPESLEAVSVKEKPLYDAG